MPEKKSGDFCFKTYRQDSEFLVAICDSELVGKEFREKDFRLFVDEKFYKDKACGEEEAKELFREATMLNLVGEKIIQIAIEEGFVGKSNVMVISKVPHAQCVKLSS